MKKLNRLPAKSSSVAMTASVRPHQPKKVVAPLIRLIAGHLQIAPNDPKVLFEQAHALIASKRDFTEAKRLLKLYMQAPLTPELPSRSEAEKLLKQAENGA